MSRSRKGDGDNVDGVDTEKDEVISKIERGAVSGELELCSIRPPCAMAREGKSVLESIGHRKRDRFEEDYDAKAKRSRVAAFIDDEADVDSDDPEDEEDDGDQDGFIVDEEDIIPDATNTRLSPLFFKEVDNVVDDADELEEFFNNRYGTVNTDHHLEEEVEQRSMLPSAPDSKFFLVKSTTAKDRGLAAQFLLSKSAILSVIAPDHLPNYIYIEAQREAHVREAIKGKPSIFGSKITMIPIDEMSDVLSADCKTANVAINDWVRIKSGTYKGDIAKVVDVDNVKQRVMVKIIPRVDLEEVADKLRGKVPKKRLILPPPRLMDIEKARDMNIPVKHKRDRRTGEYMVDMCGMMFKDGFLMKSMSMKSISTQGAEPSFIEVERFRQGGDGGATMKRREGDFMNGDTVIAVKGELKNLKGQVEKVEDGYVHIRPKSKGLPKTVAVEEKHLRKYFEIGDRVKVGMGVHEGGSGAVVKVEGDVLTVVSDTTCEEMRVFADHVSKSSEVAATDGRSEEKHGVHREKVKLQYYKGAGGDRSWIGKTVIIRGVGAYKGQRGVVRGVKGDDFRIQLDTSLSATVWVNRKDVSDSLEIFHPQTTQYQPPSSSSMIRRRRCDTPSRTPMRGGSAENESWGGMRTPLHCPAWNPCFDV